MDDHDQRLKDIIAEVARRHGVALGKDDPILILETFHARMVGDMATAVEKETQKFRQQLEEALSSYNSQVVRTTEAALNAVIEAADKAAREKMMVGVEGQLSEIRGQVGRDIESPINAAIARIIPHLKSAEHVSRLNILAASMSLLAVTASLWMMFHH
ncbi:hypothetical protein [Novosphingobium terrae]|uniref:hypothetical protein n=1 Tax=Novosphingobium terrae TaxID=2726189 RepID=UPI00197FC8B7|nr:hypothetical protein [Novosphingobium terrae]